MNSALFSNSNCIAETHTTLSYRSKSQESLRFWLFSVAVFCSRWRSNVRRLET